MVGVCGVWYMWCGVVPFSQSPRLELGARRKRKSNDIKSFNKALSMRNSGYSGHLVSWLVAHRESHPRTRGTFAYCGWSPRPSQLSAFNTGFTFIHTIAILYSLIYCI